MIAPQELRIGNITDKGIIKSFYATGIHLGGGRYYSYEEISAIELTEEWMLKFGFVKKWDNIPGLGIIEFYEHQLCKHRITAQLRMPIVGLDIKDVHQLQNLFFSITGEELQLKY